MMVHIAIVATSEMDIIVGVFTTRERAYQEAHAEANKLREARTVSTVNGGESMFIPRVKSSVLRD